MTSLQTIVENAGKPIKDYRGVNFTFNGKLTEKELTLTQLQILKKTETSPEILEELLAKYGWVSNALISFVRSSPNTTSGIARAEFRLVTPYKNQSGKKLDILRPFGALGFPVTADILLTK